MAPDVDVGYLPEVLAAAETQTIAELTDQKEQMNAAPADLEALLAEYSTLSETMPPEIREWARLTLVIQNGDGPYASHLLHTFCNRN